jgi:hypothetical protein
LVSLPAVIVKDLGYSSYRANLFSVPIYVVGAVGLWIFAWHSDRKQERGIHILVSLLFVFTGLVMVANIKSSQARYAALCILQIGSYSAPPLTLGEWSGRGGWAKSVVCFAEAEPEAPRSAQLGWQTTRRLLASAL